MNEIFHLRLKDSVSSAVRAWWRNHNKLLVTLGLALMVSAAVPRMAYEVWRLLFDSGRLGAIDLKIFHEFVNGWFTGRPVYSEFTTANYPPASFVILWPLVGWLKITPARWLFAFSVVLSLAWLISVTIREVHAANLFEKILISFFVISIYPTAVTIGNGQLVIYVVALLLASILLLRRQPQSWRRDLTVAVLMTISLVKPTVSAPFFWLVLLLPNTLRPAFLVLLFYSLLTVFAAHFQPYGFFPLMRDAVDHCLQGAAIQAEIHGYANFHSWLVAFGLKDLNVYVSLLILAGLGYWIYRNRQADIWLLLGVTAIIARIWTHHPVYEDFLILLPMVSLIRIIRRTPYADGSDVSAGGLLTIAWLAMLVPASTRLLPAPWSLLFTVGQGVIFILILLFLLYQVRHHPIAEELL